MAVTISPDELDRAVEAGVVRWRGWNSRLARCANEGCRREIGVMTGQAIWIDGHPRGYLCAQCRNVIKPSTKRKG